MNIQLQLVLPTFITPLALSVIAQRLGSKNNAYTLPSIFVIWLLSYLWIAGFPAIPPKEAIDWIGLLGTVFILISFIIRPSRLYTISIQNLFAVAGIVLVAWPVIIHDPNAQLFVELSIFSLVSAIVSFRLLSTTPASPALTLGISNAGLAVVAGLGGSLLIGQLAGALASALGAFIIYELYKKLNSALLDSSATFLIALLNLWMLVIARIYAELPLVSVGLLALSLLVGLTTKWRYASGISLIAVCSSLIWLLLTTDESSYY